jgi:hypothetical protein
MVLAHYIFITVNVACDTLTFMIALCIVCLMHPRCCDQRRQRSVYQPDQTHHMGVASFGLHEGQECYRCILRNVTLALQAKRLPVGLQQQIQENVYVSVVLSDRWFGADHACSFNLRESSMMDEADILNKLPRYIFIFELSLLQFFLRGITLLQLFADGNQSIQLQELAATRAFVR